MAAKTAERRSSQRSRPSGRDKGRAGREGRTILDGGEQEHMIPEAFEKDRRHARSGIDRIKPIIYLMTGVLVSVMGQRITSARMFLFQAHVIPAVKFVSTLVVGLLSSSGLIGRCRGRVEHTAKAVDVPETSVGQKRLMIGMGVLDTAAYILFCLGFGYCGADATAVMLPAMGQILTALFSIVLLQKQVPRGRQAAVCIVFVGVLTKAWDVERGGSSLALFSSNQGSFRIGVAYLFGASLCYSMLGVLYEFLVMSGTRACPVPSHAHIMLYSSIIGSASIAVFQIMYVFPRWEELISRPLAASGASPLGCVMWLLAFGMMYQMHSYAQGLTFQSDGALGVQLVNAVRGSVTNIVASIAFCTDNNAVCLSTASMCSGVLTTTGGILWTLAAGRSTEPVAPKKTE